VLPDKHQDRIELRGFDYFGFHGVLPAERQQGQHFVVDADLHTDIRDAAKHDDIALAVDYAKVHSTIKAVVEGTPQQLIETVAEKAAAAVLSQHAHVSAISICIKKPAAPIDGTFDYVAVNIYRNRNRSSR